MKKIIDALSYFFAIIKGMFLKYGFLIIGVCVGNGVIFPLIQNRPEEIIPKTILTFICFLVLFLITIFIISIIEWIIERMDKE